MIEELVQARDWLRRYQAGRVSLAVWTPHHDSFMLTSPSVRALVDLLDEWARQRAGDAQVGGVDRGV